MTLEWKVVIILTKHVDAVYKLEKSNSRKLVELSYEEEKQNRLNK